LLPPLAPGFHFLEAGEATAGAATIHGGAGTDVLVGDETAQSDTFTDTGSYAIGAAIPTDLDTSQAGLQTTDPLGTYFRISAIGAAGVTGVATTRLEDGTQQGEAAEFDGIEGIEGQGASNDPDTIDLDGLNGVVWSVQDVYRGVIASGGATLAYTGVARGKNSSAQGITLSYAALPGAAEYVGDVIVDLAAGTVAGFASFTGPVITLVGTEKNDVLLGGDATRLVRGNGGTDFMLLLRMDGGATIEGGAGTDIAIFNGITGNAVLTDTKLTQGGIELSLSGIEGAKLAAAAGQITGAGHGEREPVADNAS
jgi:hypothetical protein